MGMTKRRNEEMRRLGYVNHADYKWLPTGGWYELKVCEKCGDETYIPKDGKYCSNLCAIVAIHLPKRSTGSYIQNVTNHNRVRNTRGIADQCTNGCLNAKTYAWANLTGNYEDVNDYVAMCGPCHWRFDKFRVAVIIGTLNGR